MYASRVCIVKKMDKKANHMPLEKTKLHPRNLHRSAYDFKMLCDVFPPLTPFVFTNKYNNRTIDFAKPEAVKMLNKALLIRYYEVAFWDIPPQYLCPPIPGRADHIHHLADLLGHFNEGSIPKGDAIRVLDIGIGANCIYPIIGHKSYGWHFVGTDIDVKALKNVAQLQANNGFLDKSLECRIQKDPRHIFEGIIMQQDRFDLTICNPPFHSSAEEAEASSLRKVRNLGAKQARKPILNFGGQNNELWCPGGELGFIKNMISESRSWRQHCFMFSTLVSKSEHLRDIYKTLETAGATLVETLTMHQGQKSSRIVAWSYLEADQRKQWVNERWKS